MTLVKFEGKPIEKLLDVVSQGIGSLYKPRAIRNEADAEAYKKEVLAKADAKGILILGETEIELAELAQRAKERLVHQEMQRQTNIENIVEKSINHLGDDVSDVEVDNDWRMRFFSRAQDISNDDVQEIWAKILAEEVSEPGRISMRTLDVLSNLSKYEAEKFQLACSLSSYRTLIWKLKGGNFDKFHLQYLDIMTLRDAGLIHNSHSLVMSFNSGGKDGRFLMNISDEDFWLRSKENSAFLNVHQFDNIAFTIAGEEICNASNILFNLDYKKEIISYFEELEHLKHSLYYERSS